MRYLVVAALALSAVPAPQGWAQSGPAKVRVSDLGAQTRTIGPGAPAHTIGLTGITHQITLGTGKMLYGVRYVACKDPKDPKRAIPGEGYIGMPEPTDSNWYGGGFLDLKINGQSIGTTMIHSVTGRSVGDRGYADFVFDVPQAILRLRFVATAGGDCLYAQVLLEPREEIKALSLGLRCYPSAFVSNADRHVLTPTRDLKQGQKVELGTANEWWLSYYDSVYDRGYVGATYTGTGPCAALWLPGLVEKVALNVGSYSVETAFSLKPALRDFRFVFFDQARLTNAEAQADLKARAPQLQQELAAFTFADSAVVGWPLAEKQEEVRRLLAAIPEEKALAARYEQWSRQLPELLKLVRSPGAGGAILAEANAVKTITEWDAGLPALKLLALLGRI